MWQGEDATVVTGKDTMRAAAVTSAFLKNDLDIDGDSVLAAHENGSLDFGLFKFLLVSTGSRATIIVRRNCTDFPLRIDAMRSRTLSVENTLSVKNTCVVDAT